MVYSMSNMLTGIVAQSLNVYAVNIIVYENLHSWVEQYIHVNNHLFLVELGIRKGLELFRSNDFFFSFFLPLNSFHPGSWERVANEEMWQARYIEL